MSKAVFATLLGTALAIRLILIATSFGSTDALLMMSWAHIAERFGVGRAYLYAQYLNHPPLALWIAATADRVGTLIGLEFPDIFRILQTIADSVTAAILYKMTGSRATVVFFFASPAAIFLSGFHCNSDPTMVALLLASVWIASRSAAASGALLGAASGIKIAPLPLIPFFLLQMSWARRMLFVALLCASVVIPYIPVVRISGWISIRNIFGYSGSGYEWGFCGIGLLMRNRTLAEAYSHYGRFAVIAALAGLLIFYWRRPAPLATMIGVALLTMNFFAPGFGVQYLVWPLPFLLFALPRRLAYLLNAALSVFLFATYTLWSGEFPWWFANAASPDINRRLIALLALPLWLLYGVAIVAALRRQFPGQLAAQKLAEGGAGN